MIILVQLRLVYFQLRNPRRLMSNVKNVGIDFTVVGNSMEDRNVRSCHGRYLDNYKLSSSSVVLCRYFQNNL